MLRTTYHTDPMFDVGGVTARYTPQTRAEFVRWTDHDLLQYTAAIDPIFAVLRCCASPVSNTVGPKLADDSVKVKCARHRNQNWNAHIGQPTT